VDGDANNRDDVFIHDRQTGITERVSISTGGVEGDGDSDIPSISADGRYVAFASYSNNFDSSDTNGYVDCFVRDRLMGITERVSISTNGVQGDADSFNAQISGDGRYVAFESRASTLVAGDTNGTYDIFLRDRQSGTAVRVSVATSGAQSAAGSESPSISADGRYVAFDSWASDLVAGDTNGVWDTFVHDIDATGFVSMCDPGVAGVEPCPCLNPATGPGRGCDNSAATGGATFTAAGIAYLSIDTLVFTTSGEMPTALSVVMQGNASIPTGLVYGQGVRCLGGTIIRRLFTKQAVAGSITVPDFGAGDPSVSARSAVKGDVIQPGQSRWYLVYYRDPVVLGGCPASSTFNATQTGQVTWWP
jgi:hypothetical protein